MYTVKQVAEMMDISAHTLRFYDNEGLFPYVSRDQNNTRFFAESDLEWVNLVQCLRDTGMALADVKKYVELCKQGDTSIQERYGIILRQKEKAEQELLGMQKRVDLLNAKTKYYKRLWQEAANDDWNPINTSPAKCMCKPGV